MFKDTLMHEFREWLLSPILQKLNHMEVRMSTKQELDAKEQVVLSAIQNLSNLVNAGGSGGFDTAPEIATLQLMLDLANAMIAKLQGSTGVPGVPVVIAPQASLHATIGVPFTAQVSASGSPVSFSAVGLPNEFSINSSNGLISGTALTAGTSSVTVTATNSLGSGSSTFTLVEDTLPQNSSGIPVINSPLTSVGRVAIPFTYQITATQGPVSYAAVNLPSGLNLNSGNGMITGTPVQSGSTTVTISATNASGTDSEVLVVTINA